MSNTSKKLTEAAQVMRKLAAYVDDVQTQETAKIVEKTTKTAQDLKSLIYDATGEEIDDGVAEKLASSNEDVLSLVQKLAKTAAPADDMGGPDDMDEGPMIPSTTEEAVKLAEEQFVGWLTNDI